MSNETELKIIAYEYARNKAMDSWFSARPHLARSQENEFVFEGGFRIAWNTRAGDKK